MAKSYGLTDNIADVRALVSQLIADGKPFAFDIETGYDGLAREKASLHPEIGFVVGFSVTNSTEWARYIPLRHDLAVNVDPEQFALAVWPLMQTGLGVAHNAKFELRFLSELFKEFVAETDDGVYPIRSDTMIESYLVQETRGHGLKQLTKELFGHNQAELSTLFPELTDAAMRTLRFNALELTPKVVSYVCEDSAWCLALHDRNYHKVKDSLLFKTEMELIPILAEMERYGLRYDWTMLSNAATEMESFINKWRAEVMGELSDIVGEPVNINLGSAQQVSAILYDRIGLRTTRMTKTSKDTAEPKMSTDAVALEGLSKKYPYVKKMVEWREMKKLLGTYLTTYEKKFGYAPDGRTHPNVNATFIITGRVSVNDPPYQQTPKDYDYELSDGEQFHLSFRKAIMAGPEHYFVGFDYSQVELRWLAGVAQEPTLLKDFADGVDVHSRTASLMLAVPLKAVTKEQRAIGKTMNFALLYGMGVKTMAERLGVTVDEAKELNEKYFSAFSSIAVWSDRVTRQGIRDGFTMSHFGRKHRIWELTEDNPMLRAKGERMCVNAPIQGGAADYMKIAMVRGNRALAKAGLLDRVHVVMNIHDALVYEVRTSVEPALVIATLESAISYPVEGFPPIEADWGVGRRWGTMVDVVLNDDGTISQKTEAADKAEPTESMPRSVTVTKPKTADWSSYPVEETEPIESVAAWSTATPESVVSDVKNFKEAMRLGPTHDDGSVADEFVDARAQCQTCGKRVSADELIEHALSHQTASTPTDPISHSETTPEVEHAEEANLDMKTNSNPHRELIIGLTDWPTAQQLTTFKTLAAQNPGATTTTIESPDGERLTLPNPTNLSPGDSPQLSMIFHGATATYTSQSVTTEDITEGIAW
jgi:DNA polymerase I-like protein with 3'-5' exonuclease and polymerase domains